MKGDPKHLLNIFLITISSSILILQFYEVRKTVGL